MKVTFITHEAIRDYDHTAYVETVVVDGTETPIDTEAWSSYGTVGFTMQVCGINFINSDDYRGEEGFAYDGINGSIVHFRKWIASNIETILEGAQEALEGRRDVVAKGLLVLGTIDRGDGDE